MVHHLVRKIPLCAPQGLPAAQSYRQMLLLVEGLEMGERSQESRPSLPILVCNKCQT